MSSIRDRKPHGDVDRIRSVLDQRPDIAWARYRAVGPDEKSSVIKLVVMPAYQWWSALEKDSLTMEVDNVTNRMVSIEDYRAVHPHRIWAFRDEWEVLIDRGHGNSMEMVSYRDPFSGIEPCQEKSWKPWELVEILQSPEKRVACEKNFANIIDFSVDKELWGAEFWGEKTWVEICNVAEKAGKQLLALCCEVRSMLLFTNPPQSYSDALGSLVGEGVMDVVLAERLVGWLKHALPSRIGAKADLDRVRLVLDINPEDFSEFCNAVRQSAKKKQATARNPNPPPPPEKLAFDLKVALQGLESSMEHTKNLVEHDLLSQIKNRVLNRQYFGKSTEDYKTEAEGVYAQPPMASLLVLQAERLDQEFPQRVAHALYGNASLVYNIGKTIGAHDPQRQHDAVWGRSEMFQPMGNECLPEFVSTHGRGVIFFEDVQNYSSRYLSILSNMAEGYLRKADGERVFLGNLCLIICGRFPIGTLRELDLHKHEGSAPLEKYQFRLRVEDDVAARSSEHFKVHIYAKFTVTADSIWRKYARYLGLGKFDVPLVRPTPKPKIQRPELTSKPAPPKIENTHKVSDLTQLVRVEPEPSKYDFFISYSWTRTEAQARELAVVLKSRGHKVFIDKENLSEDLTMEVLVPELVYAVRSSRAVLLYPIELKEPIYNLPDEVEPEIRHGQMIRVPGTNRRGPLAEWSWQTLELMAAAWHLVIEKNKVYPTAHGKRDTEFITRPYRSIDELATACEAYLDYRCRQQEDLNHKIH